MQADAFTRFQCWRDDRIAEVINKEAVSVNRANFLATHVPLSTIRYERSPRQMTDTSEGQLLEELVQRGQAGQHAFAVVLGIPGTGKSHLIRWLKERYVAIEDERQGRDVVLLIERANCSLRGTLEQLLASGAFDEAEMEEQRKRLRGATAELSKAALRDTLLDSLKTATAEVDLPNDELPRVRIRNNIEKFLLDFTIREELKREGGPIDRLVRFLSLGNRAGLGSDELPGFEPGDFEFSSAVISRVVGYPEARDLALDLSVREPLREDLARYLNRLLGYAIGRTTALSSDDLKQMFNDLRRQLRRDGRGLVLFIEDITAFTGIDAGLVDVLATQHTGEGNREFCRLSSVIGITNGYFRDRFPDNMRERITHLLTLNAAIDGRDESDLLRSQDAAAGLVARYLNAMRLPQNDLERWLEEGARPERLPNACATCPHQPTCHAAFGSVAPEPAAAVDRPGIGLYPFNSEAVWSMYASIVPERATRTPRSLLSSVLEYVLQSHGRKVVQGNFPPPPLELGSDFLVPPLRKPGQFGLLQAQGGAEAIRIETLLRVWGDRTADVAVNASGQRLVGYLSAEVFAAFALPQIEGEGGDRPQRPEPPTHLEVTVPPPPIEAAADEPPLSAQEPYASDLSDWRNGGQLRNFEDPRQLLVKFLRSAIDWEAHGLTRTQLDDRFHWTRCRIDGQTGYVRYADPFVFRRSPALFSAINAVLDFGMPPDRLAPDLAAAHVAALGHWLRSVEAEVAEHVRRPTAQIPAPAPLVSVLVRDCLLAACLDDGLLITRDSAPHLLADVFKSCRRQPSTWGNSPVHSTAWQGLGRLLGADRVDRARKDLLGLLNRAQGDVREARFLDAELALGHVRDFCRKDWELTPLLESKSAIGEAWKYAAEINEICHAHFDSALEQDRQKLTIGLSDLAGLLGEETPERVFEAMRSLLAELREHNVGYRFQEYERPRSRELERTCQTLQATINSAGRQALAIRLSAVAQHAGQLQSHLEHLRGFQAEMERIEMQLSRRATQLATEGDAGRLVEEVVRVYDEVDRHLEQLAEATAVEALR